MACYNWLSYTWYSRALTRNCNDYKAYLRKPDIPKINWHIKEGYISTRLNTHLLMIISVYNLINFNLSLSKTCKWQLQIDTRTLYGKYYRIVTRHYYSLTTELWDHKYKFGPYNSISELGIYLLIPQQSTIYITLVGYL